MYAVLDHVEEEQQASLKRQRSSDACVKEPPTKKARQLTPKAQEAQDKLEVFEKQLAKLAETQDAEGLQTNAFLTGWRFDDDQTPWEALIKERQIPRWHVAEGVPQKASFAVLSHALWDAAFTKPYQKMILHTLYPLYEFATDQKELSDAMQVATKRLRALRFKHTYIKRRFATFSLFEATRLYNPLTGFIFFALFLKVSYHNCEGRRHTIIIDPAADNLPESARYWHLQSQANYVLIRNFIKVLYGSLQASKAQLKDLCDWDALGPYAHCTLEEGLKDNTYQNKIELGLFCFETRLGTLAQREYKRIRFKKNPDNAHVKKLIKAFRHYKKAAVLFDCSASSGVRECANEFYIMTKDRLPNGKPRYHFKETAQTFLDLEKEWGDRSKRYRLEGKQHDQFESYCYQMLRRMGLPLETHTALKNGELPCVF